MESENRTVFDVLAKTLLEIPGLKGVYPLAAKENSPLPFCVYLMDRCETIRALDRETGLFRYVFSLHIVAQNYESLTDAEMSVRNAVASMAETCPRCLLAIVEDGGSEGYRPEAGMLLRVCSVSIYYYDQEE